MGELISLDERRKQEADERLLAMLTPEQARRGAVGGEKVSGSPSRKRSKCWKQPGGICIIADHLSNIGASAAE
jgi:hypothetical protein